MAILHNTSPNEHRTLETNSGIRHRFWPAVIQLRSDAAHTSLRQHMWARQECFWAGYQNHLILVIHNTTIYDVDDPSLGAFRALQTLVKAMYAMVKRCPSASWIDSFLTRPAANSLTIYLQGAPTKSQRANLLGHDGSVKRGCDITHRDLLLLLARRSFSWKDMRKLSQSREVFGIC